MWMLRAIRQAEIAVENGQHPFGAVVVSAAGEFVAEGHNLVEQDHDSSAHGEVVAIRKSGLALGTHLLTGCTIYTTCEPCLLCTTLILYSGITRVVYGARSRDLIGWQPPLGIGLAEAALWAKQQDIVLEVTPDCLRYKCLSLYENWQRE
jgi:tRNA(adenine34) deaminase